MKILLTIIAMAAYAFLAQLSEPENQIQADQSLTTVVIATDSVEFERLSPGGGTEETVTYTYVSAPAYDSQYKQIFLDTAEVVEYNKVHKAKFR